MYTIYSFSQLDLREHLRFTAARFVAAAAESSSGACASSDFDNQSAG